MGNAWWMVWHFRACLFGCFTAIRSFAAAWMPGVIGTKWEERDRTLHAEKTEDRHSHRVIKHSRPAPPWPFQHGHGITMCCSGIHLSLYCTLDLSIWGEGFFAASLYNVPDEIVKVHLDMRLRQKSSDRHTQVQADLVYVRGAPLHWQHSTAHQTVTAISIGPMPEIPKDRDWISEIKRLHIVYSLSYQKAQGYYGPDGDQMQWMQVNTTTIPMNPSNYCSQGKAGQSLGILRRHIVPYVIEKILGYPQSQLL